MPRTDTAAATRVDGPGRGLKWFLRVLATIVGGLLALFADVLFNEAAKDPRAPFTIYLIAAGMALAGGLLTYVVFFRWDLTRANPRTRGVAGDSARRSFRSLGAILVFFGFLGFSLGLIALLGAASAPSVTPAAGFLIAFLLITSPAEIAIGIGLRRQTQWARRAAVVWAFVLFAGFPIGTFLAISIWWAVAKSPPDDPVGPDIDARRKALRVWIFASVSWAVLVFLAVLWFDPFEYDGIGDDDVDHMVSIMLIPPALVGLGKWIWDRWIK